MELYEVTEEYVSYLRRFEPKKILSNADHKNSRKFIGLIIKKGKIQLCCSFEFAEVWERFFYRWVYWR